MRAVGVERLRHLPFVRHQLDPALVGAAWLGPDGSALVLCGRHLTDGLQLVATALGSRSGLAPLLAHAARHHPTPARLLVSAGAEEAVPAGWDWQPGPRWHWMRRGRDGGLPAVDPRVVGVDDPREVEALLDREAPDSFARPGLPGIERWLGVRDEGAALLAVGAVLRQPDGTGHVRAVTVATPARGRGLGRALSGALTRAALTGPGIASLGVYVDNRPALRIYRGLGYGVVHTLVGGPVSRRSSTTAAAPSR